MPTATKKVSARAAALEVFRSNRNRPLHVGEVLVRVQQRGCKLGGKTCGVMLL